MNSYFREAQEKVPVNANVYNIIRKSIMTLELVPGQMLSEKELAVKLGVSKTPVREALIKLSREGLVNIYPQRGTAVSYIKLEDVFQAQFIRETLEVAVIRKLAGMIGDNHVRQLEENIESQKRALEKENFYEFYDYDELFHESFSSMSGFPRVWDVIKNIKVQMDRVRMFSLPDPSWIRVLINQHEAILGALSKRDADSAEKLMREHVQLVLSHIEGLSKKFPDYFV
jgi:Transcriptional regulators